MQAYVTSDVGMTREINEDYFSVSYPGDEVQLFIIADGMGGYNGGEVASKLAVQSVRNYILSNYEETDKMVSRKVWRVHGEDDSQDCDSRKRSIEALYPQGRNG